MGGIIRPLTTTAAALSREYNIFYSGWCIDKPSSSSPSPLPSFQIESSPFENTRSRIVNLDSRRHRYSFDKASLWPLAKNAACLLCAMHTNELKRDRC